MVDTYAYFHIQQVHVPPQLESLDNLTKIIPELPMRRHDFMSSLESTGGEPDFAEENTSEPLTDEQCLLASPVIKGFALQTKVWCK